MKTKLTLIMLTVLFVLAFSGTVTAEDGSNNLTDPALNAQLDSSNSQSGNTSGNASVHDPIISGTVTHCGTTDPFPGVNVTVQDVEGNYLASNITDANGFYTVSFLSDQETFKVVASLAGHIPDSKEVTVNPNPNDPSDPNFYATANLELGPFAIWVNHLSWTFNTVDALNDLVYGPFSGTQGYPVDVAITPNGTTAVIASFYGDTYFVDITNPTSPVIIGSPVSTPGIEDCYVVITPDGKYALVTGSTNPGYNNIIYVIDIATRTVVNSYADFTNVVGVAISPDGQTVIAANYYANQIRILNLNTSTGALTSLYTLPVSGRPINVAISPDGRTALVANEFTNVIHVFRIDGVGNVVPTMAISMPQTPNSIAFSPDGTKAYVTLYPNLIAVLNVNSPGSASLIGIIGLPGSNSPGSAGHQIAVSPDGTKAYTTLRYSNLVAVLNLLTNTVSGILPAGTYPLGIAFATTSQADLAVTKIDSPDPVIAGNQLTYTITVTNNGPSTLNGFTLADSLPAGFTVTNWTPSAGSYDSATGAWTGLNLASGQSVTLTITGTVGPGVTGTLTNTVIVSPPAGVTDPNTANNQATETTNVNCQSNLAVTKIGSPDPVIAGNLLTYAMSITNNGPSVAHVVTFRDTLPLALTGVQYSVDNINWFYYTSGQEVGFGNLNVGQTVNFWIRGIVDAATLPCTIINTVTVYTNGIQNNQTAATTTVIRQSDLSITKTDSLDPVKTSQTLTYTLTVTNNGPSTLNGFTLADSLPAGFTVTSWTPSAGSYDPVTGAWTGLNLASGQSVTLTITGTVDSGISETLTNTVTVSPPAGVTDPNTANNQATETTTVNREADLVITKTVDNSKPKVKDTIQFTLIVNNFGPDTAVNVQVADKLPAGLKFVKYTTNYGTYDPETGMWNIGNIPTGARAEITITSVVENSGNIINEAKVTSLTYDPNLEGNTATATIDAQQPVVPEVNAANETVPMQPTGIPLTGLILAILAVFGGLLIPKRK